MAKQKKNGKCRVKGCSRAAFTRGVCHACYELMRRSVFAGDTSWQDLEATGILLKDRRYGRKSPVHRVIKCAKKKTGGVGKW